jgi:serine/threonine protein kinase
MMDGIPKIADLGIAKAMKTEGLSTKIGTMFYASQEFLHEETYEYPADIWSLGIIFWEMLSGKRINQVVKGLIAPSIREGFPSAAILDEVKEEDLRELVRKMLAKDP